MKKILIIFGAFGALGRGVSKTLLSRDFTKCYLFDMNIDSLNQENVLVYPTDKIDENSISNAFARIPVEKDAHYFLFSSIGGYIGGKEIDATELSDLEEMLDKNLRTNFLILKNFINLVKQSLGGGICFTSALTGLTPTKEHSVYGLTKSSLNYLIQTAALEGREFNLSVNGIAPSVLDTPANRTWMSEQDLKNALKPEEIGDLVYDLFKNFFFISGNIITLLYRFNDNKNNK